MSLDLAPDAYVLPTDAGEALWFADSLVTYKATGIETRGGLTVAEVRAPRGAGSPRHRHHNEDEAWYVMEGELTFWLGDEQQSVAAGSFVFGPRGIDHRFRVDSDEAHFLLLLTPAGFEEFTRACGWPATSLTMPPDDLPAAGRRSPPGGGSPSRARHRSRATHTHTTRSHAMITTYKAATDIDVLTSSFPVPGFGLIPINAFVLHATEPVLVDTGTVVESDEFMDALASVIDPSDLRWIWLTHTDFDHIGSLHRLLAENPRLRVITTFLGVGIMGLSAPLPMDRVHLVNPGQTITVGDRTLTAVKPPAFDNPVTTGLYDDRSGALFSADCFGALLADVPQRAEDLSDDELHEGQVFWATVDSPWLHKVDRGLFAQELDGLRALDPALVLSSHLPAAQGASLDRLLVSLESVPAAPSFVGPDQAALEQMLAQMTGPVPDA